MWTHSSAALKLTLAVVVCYNAAEANWAWREQAALVTNGNRWGSGTQP